MQCGLGCVVKGDGVQVRVLRLGCGLGLGCGIKGEGIRFRVRVRVSWNTMIRFYAIHGYIKDVLKLFDMMKHLVTNLRVKV